MKRIKKELYLVHYNGFYVRSAYLIMGELNLTTKIEDAKVFDSLRQAKKLAEKLGGEVLFYFHESTTHFYGDAIFNSEADQ